MNYIKIYDNIIFAAKIQNRTKLRKNQKGYIYYENHHIVPKCLGGNDDEENLVLLTAREHFVCHKLLTYIHKNNRKIACAFHKMTFGNSNKCIKKSYDYKYARELFMTVPVSEETRQKQSKSHKGKKFSKEHKHNLSISVKKTKDNASDDEKKRRHYYTRGEKNGMFGKEAVNKGKHRSKETIKRIKANTRLAMQRPEVKQKQKENKSPMFGEKNGMYKKHHSKKSKEKISNTLKNTPKIECQYCKKSFYPWHYSRSHGDKCKHK
jgi:hypothetical protein